MKIVEYRLNDLREAISSDRLWQGRIFPITKLRAISYINNPQVTSEDILLMVAFDEITNEVTGYIGAIPAFVYFDNEPIKIAWLSTWWVDSNASEQGIGAILFQNMLSAYQYRVGVSGFAASVEKIYLKSKQFVYLKELKGIQLQLKTNYYIKCREKFPKFKLIASIFYIVDFIINSLLSIEKNFCLKKTLAKSNQGFEEVKTMGEEVSDFLAKHNLNDLTRLGINDLNWRINNSWLADEKEYTLPKSSYYFSSTYKKELIKSYLLRDDKKQIQAYFIIHQLNNTIRVPYLYAEDSVIENVLDFILLKSINQDGSSLILFEDRIVNCLNNKKLPFLNKKETYRKSFISKYFKKFDFDKVKLNDGDGDSFFTI